ncbi:hypothetical protein [[Clostridium] innocuum]|nr:hypothetical protein [[Clostridium] innocuum]PWJ19784.1 hypothetical protein ATF84_101328 [[Clostridium] innocuum]SSA37506.1 hypothetical protein SAMN04487929_101328 [[Clostridium] innocuum]
MKKNILFKILLVLAFVLAVISLAAHNDITLIIATILIAVCVVLSFVRKE